MLFFAVTLPTLAHPLRPSVADVTVGRDRVEVSIRLTLEPLVAGMDLASLTDTNDSPLSGYHDRLRTLHPEVLEAAFQSVWPAIRSQFFLTAGETALTPDLLALRVPAVGDVERPRESVLTVGAALPDDGTPVRIGWSGTMGPLSVRHVSGERTGYTAILRSGEMSAPLPRAAVEQDDALQTFTRYVASGFHHIVPMGTDHILFVLGLFFYSLRLGPLLAQITAFTAAHTISLALAALGILSVPSSIVEPLIALSIVYVAVENMLGAQFGWARIAVVFGFGLLHGLGFATVLEEVGLQGGQFAAGLIGFNIGVELGQLIVVLAAFILVGLPFGHQPWYRARVAIPASAVIAAVGAWWTVTEVFL
ncbi:HupE/UreJ family protein [Tropicimonas marinistellae]|uniref:HupE/UreJ family protein n=1 Tax=Tropicimonas marinistellae TaxID=1739787 RepID=UPI00082BFD84|nr:HupE/UreJ family protein [Tropicimonas marinistellae]